jgi:hypothetical protein
MTGGADLLGAPIEAPRKRGRPKGSGNRRAKDLKGIIDARYGGSAAQQSAQMCMVTPAELKAAGGSMAKAQVNKALDLVKHVREAQDRRDEALRALVREELHAMAEVLDDEDRDGMKLRAQVSLFIKRVREASSSFGLREALDLITKERANLLPYTDMRQPLAVDVTSKGHAPSVVIMGSGGEGGMATMPTENVGVFDGAFEVVSRPVSHDAPQTLALPGLEGLAPGD